MVAASTDISADVSLDKVPTGGGFYISVIGRGTARDGYRVTARIQTQGSATLSLNRVVGGVSTKLSSQVVNGLTTTPGSWLRIRLAVTGSAPTTTSAKIWNVGSAEPGSWQTTAADTKSDLPGSGGIGLVSYLSSSATTGAVTFQYDNVTAKTSMAAPPPSGMPTAGTTGVPDGTTLKTLDPNKLPYSADQYFTSSQMLVINTPNAVYDAYKFDCFVEVRAPGVRISRSLIRGQAVSYQRPMLAVSPSTYAAGQPSAVIEDSTVDPAVRSSFINGVQGSNFTLRRVEVTGVVDGVHIHGTSTRTDPNAGNVTVQASWIHDLPHYPYDGGANGVTTADGSHNDGVQFVGGHNVSITGTRIDGTISNAGIMMAKDRNDIYTINISNNWLGGGAVTINVADKGYTPVQGLVMNNNVFFRGTTRHVDFAMLVSPGTRAIAIATGNTWHDGSSPEPYMRLGS